MLLGWASTLAADRRIPAATARRPPSSPARPPSAPDDEARDDDDDDDDPLAWHSTSLAIVLPDLGDGRVLTWAGTAALDPEVYWPRAGGTDLADALLDVVDLREPTGSAAERAWVDAVFDALPEAIDDPDTAILALEATRRAERIDRADALAEAALSLSDGEQVAASVLLGPEDPVDTEDVALALLDRWPAGPAAEIARLYLVEAATARGAVDEALARFDELDAGGGSPAVLAQAAGLVSRLDPAAVVARIDAQTVAALGEALDADPDAVAELDLAAFGTELALHDRGALGPWLDRLESAFAAQCDPDALADEPICAQHAANLDDLVARVGGLEAAEAVDWEQGAKIATHACAEGVPRPIRVEAAAEWRGSWTFHPWDRGPAELTACIERGIRAAPTPTGPLHVRITVIGYP